MQDKTVLTTINEILHTVKRTKEQEDEQTQAQAQAQDQDDVMQCIYTLGTGNVTKFVKPGTKRIYWTASDTDKFYAALKKYGTNFSLIKLCFPRCNRRQILIKYKHELKYRPMEIALAVQVYKERF